MLGANYINHPTACITPQPPHSIKINVGVDACATFQTTVVTGCQGIVKNARVARRHQTHHRPDARNSQRDRSWGHTHPSNHFYRVFNLPRCSHILPTCQFPSLCKQLPRIGICHVPCFCRYSGKSCLHNVAKCDIAVRQTPERS